MFETKMTIKNVIEQLDTQLKQPVEESPFYRPDQEVPGRLQRRRQGAA